MFRSRDRQFTSHACVLGRRWMYVSHKRKNKMKTVVSVVLLTAVFLDLSAQSFTIRGRFIDVANDTLSIGYVQREPEKRVVDVDVPVDAGGCFTYSCDIGYACLAELTIRSSGKKAHLFFVPDERVEIEGPSASMNDWNIGGTAFYQRQDRVRQLLLPFYREFDAARARYDKGVADGLGRGRLDSIRAAAYRDINKGLWRVAHQYIMGHLDDEVSVPILLDQNYPDILPAIRSLSPEVRYGRFKSYIDGIEGMFSRLAKEEKAAAAATLELEEGKSAPDFTLNDMNGKDFRLSALFGQGKYIVVDFWGSWCSWCIKGFPAMEEYYNRYKDKLEIVGVACYDKEERWKDAVVRNQVPWQHVISPDGTTEVRYGVTAYPFKVIVSPEGTVIKSFKGETAEFYRMLDKLLQ